MTDQVTRRSFLKAAGLAGAGVTLAACSTQAPSPSPASTQMVMGPEGQGGDIDAEHEARVKIFLDGIGKDPAFWGTRLRPTMDGDTKVFELTCQDIQWEVQPGTSMPAMAYNGIVPGPEIRVREGDKVRVIVHNEMAQSTAVHFHGVLVPNAMDGVPYVTQPPIKSGETFTYEFTARNPGSHMYHSHHNAAEQVTRGLLGAFIIEPADSSGEPASDAEYTMVLNDTALGFTINGKSFPYTQPILAKLGDRLRIRYMNEGLLVHPMHLHGLPQRVVAKDGWSLPQPYTCDTLSIAPGERYDVLVECSEPGAWAFHCHVLTHAESAHGMFGMVTAVVVS